MGFLIISILFSLFILSKSFPVEDDIDSDADFGGFVKNMFSRIFSGWPFNSLDNFDNLDLPAIEEDSQPRSEKKNHTDKIFNTIKWYPIDFEKICKNKSKIDPVCGKNKINTERICGQISKGATVKAYCSSENSSDDTASFRMTMRYIKESIINNKTHNATKTKEEESDKKTFQNKNSQIKTEKPDVIKHTSKVISDNKPLQLETKSINRRGIVPFYLDIEYDADLEKDELKAEYNLGMYGIAMSSGALGTILVVILIVVTYSVVRLVKIRNSQGRINKAKIERKKLLRLQKLSALISDDSDIDRELNH